jgi:hypothetical protein
VVLLLITTPIKQANAQPPDSPYGVTLESKEAGSQTDASSQWIRNTGMSWVRLQEHEKKQEISPNQWDFSLSDAQVAMSLAHGLKIDWALQAPPTWEIQPGCQQVPQAAPLASYAVRVFQRYGSAISAMEVGNEEWSFDHVLACRSPQNYAGVFNTVAQALRNAGYHGLIGMFGYTNYDTVEQISAWFSQFDQLVNMKLLSFFNFHFYHEGQDPNVALKGKPALMQVVGAIHQVALGHQFKPVWLTEYGYRTHCDALHPYPCNAVTPDQQAQYEREILEDGRLSKGVLTHAFVYTLEPGQQVMSLYQNSQPLPAATMEAQESTMYPTWR